MEKVKERKLIFIQTKITQIQANECYESGDKLGNIYSVCAAFLCW